MSIFKTSTKDQLESFVSNHWNELNKYLDDKFNQMPTPIYSSVDIEKELINSHQLIIISTLLVSITCAISI